ncbi:hypothetical protein [Mesorhizobium sp. B4-1-4]|uniref:hypothetical protein n=1 Tax=Mesorhizobium sp. B4-1-4 TaxID=2589888 RepID=UPI00112A1677|nr:hypothetical protein [Mesorhizobium sp. B4-1-4]UCI30503.1 hypothetical protein FJW03_22230 [Mesorhizobium sp. B4-1-4]
MANKKDSGLRLLVACACIAIIAGVGYYFIGEYRAYGQDEATASKQALDAALRQGCLDDLKAALQFDPAHPYTIANCLYMGALSEAEVSSREIELGTRLR